MSTQSPADFGSFLWSFGFRIARFALRSNSEHQEAKQTVAEAAEVSVDLCGRFPGESPVYSETRRARA
jgi:hypothetical protein